MKDHSINWIILATLTMLFSLFIMVGGRVEASNTSNVTLTLQDSSPRADVSPHSTGLVKMQGEVSCTKYGPNMAKVFLTGSSDFGPAHVIPSKFPFSGGNGTQSTVNFTVTTRVPRGYTSMETPQVTVSGYFIQSGLRYEIPPVTQVIEIEPYYDIEVDPPPPQEIEVGDFVYFPIKITNKGNAEDTYEFIIMNLEYLCDEMWVIQTITPKTFLMGQTRTITVSALAPQTWTLWRNKVTPIELRILSQQSMEEGGSVRYHLTLHVRQKGSYISGFGPTFALTGVVLVALVMGRRRLSYKKPPNFQSVESKDLYGKLSMNMR